MSLSFVSRLIVLLVLVLLAITGFYPTPTMIGLTALASSALVLWQTYAILRDDVSPATMHERTGPKGYLKR